MNSIIILGTLIYSIRHSKTFMPSPFYARWTFFLAAVLIPFVISEAQANENVDNFELSPEQLFDATVMSVSKTSEKLMDAPAAVYVLTNEDILRSGATSIPEALRIVPGVQVAQVNANSWAISVRGFNGALADKLLVLMDGREVYDPLFAGVYWDIQNTMLEDVERIEVIRGPGAALWGANAVNGVINIITKKAQDTQGNLVSLTAGNQEKGIVEERYGGRLGDAGYYRVYGKYLDRNDETTPAGTDAHDGLAQGRTGLRADWKNDKTARDDFTVQGDMYRSDTSDFRSVPTFVSPFSQLQNENIDARGANILGRWNRAFSDDSYLTVQSYVDYTSRDQLTLGDRETTLDMDAQYALPALGRHKIILGGGYRYNADQLTQSQIITFQNGYQATNIMNAFAQDKITLVPQDWFLTLGSKLEHNDFTGFEIEPDARLQWQINDRQMAWGSVSRAVRTPSILERELTINEGVLSLGGTPAELLLQPNNYYASEDMIAYELGYRNQLTPKTLLDVTAFYNHYTYLATLNFLTPSIVFTPPAHFLFPVTFTNNTYGETHGIETVLDWRALDTLKFSTSYSILEMHLHGPTPDQAIGSELAQQESPTYQFNIRGQWDIRKNISFDTTLYYVSSLPAYAVDDYWRLDMRLAWKIMNGLQFSLVGQNLLAPPHREFSSATDANAALINQSIFGNLTWQY